MATVLCATVFTGEVVLRFFDISLDAFRVAGGILLLMMALSMLQARRGRSKQTPEETREAIESTSVAVVPLTMPLLAGPGAISAVILFSHQVPGFFEKSVLIVICLLLSVITWLFFDLSVKIEKYISATAINIVMRVMGLILAAISVEFIAEGLKALLPGLAV